MTAPFPDLEPGTDESWMNLAIAEARAALAHEDVPVGAIVVRDGEVIAARHNKRELTGDPTAHAEIRRTRSPRPVGRRSGFDTSINKYRATPTDPT